jgi:hypothetical protein
MNGIEENIIAKCYIDKEGDENNVCFLSDTSLHLIVKGRTSSFFVQWVLDISFKRKKYLLPIILGGIIAPLAALGLFQYYLNPWIMMSFLIISSMSIYYGFEGGLALCITTPIKEYDFFIKKATPNLKAFMSYARRTIEGDSIRFYFKLKQKDWENAKITGHFIPPESGIALSISPLKRKENTEVIVYLESKDLPVEIKYQDDGTGNLVPKVFNQLPIEFINIFERTD